MAKKAVQISVDAKKVVVPDIKSTMENFQHAHFTAQKSPSLNSGVCVHMAGKYFCNSGFAKTNTNNEHETPRVTMQN